MHKFVMEFWNGGKCSVCILSENMKWGWTSVWNKNREYNSTMQTSVLISLLWCKDIKLKRQNW